MALPDGESTELTDGGFSDDEDGTSVTTSTSRIYGPTWPGTSPELSMVAVYRGGTVEQDNGDMPAVTATTQSGVRTSVYKLRRS